MNLQRLQKITDKYRELSIGVLGDFCLDRYLEIDPERTETSIETGLPVHNVVRVRAQPGGAGTILNNLVALGVGQLVPLSFAGDDGEGFELARALRNLPGVCMDSFLQTPERRTFTYCKPLLLDPNSQNPPRELNRLDSKNWTPTPADVEDHLIASLRSWIDRIDALILMEQVDTAETGSITRRILDVVSQLAAKRPELCILADSRRSLRDYSSVILKMNRAELGVLLSGDPLSVGNPPPDIAATKVAAAELARRHGRRVFVSLAEDGLLGADPNGEVVHRKSFPLRGEIDIVGAGDSVTANLTAALAAGASLAEAIEIASAAASVVIHQLGTTGTASVAQISALLEHDLG